VLGGRQAVTLLHTLSWWTGGLFLGLSLILSLLAPRGVAGASDVQQRLRTAPAPVAPAPLNQAPATTPGVTVPAPAPAEKPNAQAKPPATK
jgi:preprotein translocase subunit SecG